MSIPPTPDAQINSLRRRNIKSRKRNRIDTSREVISNVIAKRVDDDVIADIVIAIRDRAMCGDPEAARLLFELINRARVAQITVDKRLTRLAGYNGVSRNPPS